MIKIGKKEAVLSYANYLINAISNIIIIPVIIANVSTGEYGLWTIFLSISSLVSLLDLGYGNVTRRYFTYAYCGARNITVSGVPEVNDDGKTNFPLLYEIFFITKRIYKKVSLLVTFALVLFTFYILYKSQDQINTYYILLAWALTSFGVIISIYFNFYNCLLKGVGKVKELQTISIITSIGYLLLRLIFILYGMGLLGIAIAHIITVIAGRIMVIRYVKPLLNTDINAWNYAKQKVHENKHSLVKEVILKNSKKMGIISISNFLEGQGNTLLLSIFFTLETTAKYGLTMHLISIVISIAKLPFSIFSSRIGELIIIKNKEKFNKVISLIILSAIIILTLGFVGIFIFGNPILALLKTNTTLLSSVQLIMIFIYQSIMFVSQLSTDIITLGNQQTFVKAYIISSFSSICLATVILWINSIYNFGDIVIIYFIVNIIVQVSYNGWKWPSVAIKTFDIKINEIVPHGIQFFKSILLK